MMLKETRRVFSTKNECSSEVTNLYLHVTLSIKSNSFNCLFFVALVRFLQTVTKCVNKLFLLIGITPFYYGMLQLLKSMKFLEREDK